jgi:hypothetical protein
VSNDTDSGWLLYVVLVASCFGLVALVAALGAL